MKENCGKSGKKHLAVQCCRLLVQAAAMTVAVVGSFALVRNMGLPPWAFAAIVIVGGMFFCGWVCPFGTTQEWLRLVGKRIIGKTLHIPARINRYLLFSRYALLLLGGVLVLSALDSRRNFIMAVEGTGVETAAYVVLGAVLVLSLFMERPFCKYLCGFGAISGLTSMLRILSIKRDRERCSGCGTCTRSCQMGVEVAKAYTIRDPHCINCGICLAACPVPDALKPAIALPCMEDVRSLKRKYLSGGDSSRSKRNAA